MLYVKTNATGDTIIAYPYSPTDLILANPNTSFPVGPLSQETLAEWSVFPVEVVSPPVFDPRAQRLVHQPPLRDENTWKQRWGVEPLSLDEVAAIEMAQAAVVRADRNARLSACDWTQLADAPVDSLAWGVYRQELREVPQQSGFPFSIQWPSKPE